MNGSYTSMPVKNSCDAGDRCPAAGASRARRSTGRRRADQRDEERRLRGGPALNTRTSSISTIVAHSTSSGRNAGRLTCAVSCSSFVEDGLKVHGAVSRLLLESIGCAMQRQALQRRRRFDAGGSTAVADVPSRLGPVGQVVDRAGRRWASCNRTRPADRRPARSHSTTSGTAIAISRGVDRRADGRRAGPCTPAPGRRAGSSTGCSRP